MPGSERRQWWSTHGWSGVAAGLLLLAAPGICRADLDSLETATLQRALDYLELTGEELGFDKLYAQDDTFRLGVVEELLGDPLRFPAWQAGLVAELRGLIDDPAGLMARLGVLCEAPGGGRGVPPATVGVAAGTAHLLSQTRAAAEDLARALGEITPAERSQLLMIAPVAWGDGEDAADKLRKGRLHFEQGVGVDTTLELTEDFILDLAVKLDRPALTRAARRFLEGVVPLCSVGALPADRTQLPGVTGDVIQTSDTPWGLFVIGGPGDNTYSAEALARIAFLLEPGGDDIYRGRVASAVGGLTRSFSALIDLAGDDFYDARGCDYVLGGGLFGVAALFDLGGNDVYRGDDGAAGAGFFGAGLLYDGAGVDLFEGRNLSQGAGAFGLGALISDCSRPAPPGPQPEADRAFEAGLRRVPGTGAMPIRYDENDTYLCARQSQGFASTFGAGLLYDAKGSDIYRSGGRYLHAPLLPDDFQSLSQGFSIGFRPRAGGGVGILMDEEGNDFYAAEVYAQGAAYWYSIGLLFDGGGNDRYLATQYAQGAGIHLASGSLWDRGGDDHYACKFGVTQGTAHDLSTGWLYDESGNDYYLVSDGQGMSITNSVALFIDSQGDDFYATPRSGQGTVTWSRGFCGAGIFLDLEGKDTYSRESPGADGGVWRQRTYGLGIDLDRDLQLPGEERPEIVLSAADSARMVEELFETASIWEVGSAREKVRRARMALIAKGMEAVRYVVAEKLGTRSGLEYRAISELARAFPDSFGAAILPRLEDEDEEVQRTVIGLLGDLKHAPGREPLERMLTTKRHLRHWTRVISALGRLGDAEAARALRPFLRDKEERRRIYTVVALAALRDTASVEELSRMLGDEALTVRAAAARALRGFRTAAIAHMCARLNKAPGHRALCIETLGQIASALRDSTDEHSLRARGRLRRVLRAEMRRGYEDDAPACRAAAARALVELGESETIDYLRRHMLDEFDPLVRRTYEEALEAAD